MKKSFLLLTFAFSVILCGADIQLPPAEKSGGMALAEALNIRHTVRRYQDKALTLQELANILWSANGVNRPDGKRTAPSARNRQEISLCVTMKEGSFYYDPAAHMLKKISDEDLRHCAGRFSVPCYIILIADLEKQPREHYAAMDTGYVSQNIYLAAAAQKLGTCAIGSIPDRETLSRKLLNGKKKIMLTHSLGVPAK